MRRLIERRRITGPGIAKKPKLTPSEVDRIRAMYAEGKTTKEIAYALGRSLPAVRRYAPGPDESTKARVIEMRTGGAAYSKIEAETGVPIHVARRLCRHVPAFVAQHQEDATKRVARCLFPPEVRRQWRVLFQTGDTITGISECKFPTVMGTRQKPSRQLVSITVRRGAPNPDDIESWLSG
jgi:hypothetical protein